MSEIILSSPQYLDLQSIQFLKSSCSAEEEMSRVLLGVYTDVGEQQKRPEMELWSRLRECLLRSWCDGIGHDIVDQSFSGSIGE